MTFKAKNIKLGGNKMKKCLVEVYNSKTQKSEWIEGKIIDTRAGYLSEDFDRIDVILKDGRKFNGCHPKCVRGWL